MAKYKRVILKLSGEQFQGKRDYGIDAEFLHWIAGEVKKVVSTGTDVIIIVGAGNLIRGASFSKNGIERTTADYMGMLGTIMNGMALTDVLEQNDQPTRLMTRLSASSVAEPYIRRRALRHMEKGRVVIIAGGTGNPYVTTDTAAVLAASELGADAVLKATKVDGVYDKDPETNPDAKKFDEVDISQALENQDIKVMDKAAIAMAQEEGLEIIVFNLKEEGNIARAAAGERIGTKVS
ncbi:UMP kinase [Candidatus Saccharibacteria bacterium]|nr:UMP kinase [Candidatus Saccharibacteria bacterium]